MRHVVAALLACLLVVMTAADPVACADGCTDAAPPHAVTPHASGSCALCLGWNHTPMVLAPRPVPQTVPRVAPVRTRLLSPALPPLERPPRTA